ncbi:hypothetical protein BJ878DRAFT_584236 [Calycina marina]|uniref:Uncharacterized protein n=1 Tax=Calycina marina TaxID=1763456 RepID=A0A9P7YY06_9HELO|nr:hypothetical protein BJ878DRAFT_584236 [Calycina marina]
MALSKPEVEANALIAPRKFHPIFVTPVTESRGALRITFAIAGAEEGEDVETIMFYGGMFGVRWQALWQDYLATKHGVRVLFIDRAGTIHGLNILTHHPHLLSPTSPNIIFFSPWVHQSITCVFMLGFASKLPDEKRDEEARCRDGYGIGVDVKHELDKRATKWVFTEQSAANDEARLCLKSVPGTGWLASEDLEGYARVVAAVWQGRIKEAGKKFKINLKGIGCSEKCWSQSKCGSGIEVGVEHMKCADHDSTAAPSGRYIGRMFEEIGGGKSRYATAGFPLRV